LFLITPSTKAFIDFHIFTHYLLFIILESLIHL